MSVGIVGATSEPLPETVYVVTKKLGIHPREQIAVTDEQTVRQWLERHIGSDRALDGELHWKEYNKTVVESSDGDVYGHIEEVDTL